MIQRAGGRDQGAGRKGYTLTEVAIVLGIVGLVLGAIWAAADRASSRERLARGISQVERIAIGVRDIYRGRGLPSAGDATALLNQPGQGVFTEDMIPNPWQGVTQVFFVDPQTFDIRLNLNGPSTPICLDLLTSLPGTGQDGAPNAIAFFNGGGPAVVVTNQTPVAMANAINGAGGCTAVAFRYAL